ncbi:hypothetical protein GQF03_00085 [Sneathiella chungangensis]|uniref:Uncharacterized protein n=1 Tax=Sneathiella chungangensis TaxID=1418234 RepID=A0A845M5G3_9PROT|nr:hypothetical protein [Sneathiella chungangensis]MZR20723.1 hypothetical protein [Sneathiella chungangensis]
MEWRKISSGSSRNLTYVTYEYHGEYIHAARIMGTVGKEERFPFIKFALDLNTSENFFSIFDNRDNHDSVITYVQLLYFGDIFREAGIRRVFTVSVTPDDSIAPVNRLMEAVADTKAIHAEAFSTPDYDQARDFIMSRITKVTSGT